MAAFETITIRRLRPDGWDYAVEIVTRGGGRFELTASAEELDSISFAIEEQLALMVAAAEQLDT